LTFLLGTDGWRGVIADGCTFEAVRRVASATAAVYPGLPSGDTRRIVVGYDTRFFSPEFAEASAEELARGGLDVLLSDRPIPTPAVSHHVRRLRLAGGLAVTASHNPAQYNGVKIKASFGGSAPPDLYAAVESARPAPAARRSGRIERIDLLGGYRDHLASLVDLSAVRAAGLSLLADSMHGTAGTLLADILSGGATRVVPFRSTRDVLFGGVHPEPIGSNLAAAKAAMLESGCGMAVAQDGDADRLGVLDGRGRFVSPHRVLALLLLHAFRRRGLSGGIAKTFSTSLLIDRVADRLSAPLFETAIGFKYVAELMNAGRAAAGGEESGGYAFAFHLPERDGVFSALLLDESLALAGRDLDGALAGLAAEFGEFAYDRRDVYLPVPVIRDFLEEVRLRPPSRLDSEAVTDVRDKDGIKYLLDGRGWLLHRLSGTEPMLRIYCEHEKEESVPKILDAAFSRLEGFARARGAAPRTGH
jgi:phosphomannomutase